MSLSEGESLSDAFMSAVHTSLVHSDVLVRANVDAKRAFELLEDETRTLIGKLVVSRSDRTNRLVQRALTDYIAAHRKMLADARDGQTPTKSSAGEYRALVVLVSLHQRPETGVNPDRSPRDALLSFELTADQPSADELDSESESVKASLARVRSDLRIALLDGDLTTVFALTESEIVEIARKREAHASLANEDPLPAAFGESRLKALEEAPVALLGRPNANKLDQTPIIDRLLVPMRAPTNMATVLAAAHLGPTHHKQRVTKTATVLADLKIYGARGLLAPLDAWNDPVLDAKVLNEIEQLIINDDQYNSALHQIDAFISRVPLRLKKERPRREKLQTALAPEYDRDYGLLQREPTTEFGALRSLFKPWNLLMIGSAGESASLRVAQSARRLAEKPESYDGDTDIRVQTQRRLLMVQIHVKLVGELVYLASMAGTLAARVQPVYAYENGAWRQVKESYEALATSIDVVQSGVLYESLLRNFATSVARSRATVEQKTAAYTRIARVGQDLVTSQSNTTREFGRVAVDAVAQAAIPLDARALNKLDNLVEGAAGALVLMARSLAQTASLMAIAASLARGISIDAAGDRRGIDAYAFGDTLHAATDVATHTYLAYGAPILLQFWPTLSNQK